MTEKSSSNHAYTLLFQYLSSILYNAKNVTRYKYLPSTQLKPKRNAKYEWCVFIQTSLLAIKSKYTKVGRNTKKCRNSKI